MVSVSDRFLIEIPRDSIAFRSQHVADIDPAAVSEIAIEAFSTTFRLERQGVGWVLKSPQAEKADSYLIQSLLTQLDGLQTSEFLDPARVIRPELDPPLMTLKIWQSASNGPAARAKRVDSSEAVAQDPCSLTPDRPPRPVEEDHLRPARGRQNRSGAAGSAA